jgi:hypothetical protein
MERFPIELLYVLAFFGFILFNYLMQKAARRRKQDEPPQAPEAEPQAAAPDEPLDDYWGRARVPAPATAPATAPAVTARPAPLPVLAAAPARRRAHPVRALLNDKRELRRAVILAMVVGPCRAQEPPER